MKEPILSEWSAKRSGAYLTIEGRDMQGNPVKLAQVTSIQIDTQGPFAILADETTHRLETALPEV